MSRHPKANRSRMSEYQIQRELAQQTAAERTLQIQIDSLTQQGLAKIVERAFDSASRKSNRKESAQ